jgi:YD repeat-containing protein
MWHTERDDVTTGGSGPFHIERTYNSDPYDVDATAVTNAAIVHTFGLRWTQPYDSTIVPQSASSSGQIGTCWQRQDTMQVWCESPAIATAGGLPAAVAVVRGDGKKYLFNRSGTSWKANSDISDQLTATYNVDNTSVMSWAYVSGKDGSTERYDSNGKLIAIVARNGTTRWLTYSDGATNDTSIGRIPVDAPVCKHVQTGATLTAGRLLCVTDDWGRQLSFEYDGKGRIIKAFDPANQATVYAYDGPSGGCSDPASGGIACAASNLTSVTYPAGKVRTYYYNEAVQINNGAACSNVHAVGNGFGHLVNTLTGIVDENGARYLTTALRTPQDQAQKQSRTRSVRWPIRRPRYVTIATN